MLEFLQSVPPKTYATLGLLVIAVTMLMRSRKYFNRERMRRDVTPQEAEETVVRPGERPKVLTVHTPGHGTPRTVVKMPVSERQFVGATMPASVAKWEVEIHELGRQTIARINTKLVALQTLITEANRIGDRVETMIQRLERLSQRQAAEQQVTQQHSARHDHSTQTVVNKPVTSLDGPEQPFGNLLKELEAETIDWEAELDGAPLRSPQEPVSTWEPPPLRSSASVTPGPHPAKEDTENAKSSGSGTVLPQPVAMESPQSILPDLPKVEREIDVPDFPEPAQPAVASSPSPTTSPSLRIPPNGLNATLPISQPVRHQIPPARSSEGSSGPSLLHFPASSVSRPDSTSGLRESMAVPTVSNPPSLKNQTSQTTPSPQFSSLFESEVAGVSAGSGPVSSTPAPATAVASRPVADGRHDLRQQVFLLADYGYSPKEIAAQLSRPIGEIELILNLRK